MPNRVVDIRSVFFLLWTVKKPYSYGKEKKEFTPLQFHETFNDLFDFLSRLRIHLKSYINLHDNEMKGFTLS